MSSESLQELRAAAFAIAYRMLGSVSEAEDVVQEGLVRLHQAQQQGQQISSLRAYLSTIVTRLAIDTLRSARMRREHYIGEWLPEPILTSHEPNPARRAEMADSLSLAFLILLENLTPEQRAVFLLREVFDYSYAEIAEIIARSEAAARQLAVRARRRVKEHRPRFETTRAERDALADHVVAAIKQGDLETLETFLAADVSLHGDGGGNVPTLAAPVFGRKPVARLLHAWLQSVVRSIRVQIQRVEMNGHPGAITRDSQGRLLNVLVFDVPAGQVQTIRSIANPEKLAHLGPVGDLAGLLRFTRPSRGSAAK